MRKFIAGEEVLYNVINDNFDQTFPLGATAQTTPGMTLFVNKGVVRFADTVVKFAGGNSPVFVAPTTNPRIDLLVLDSTGTLSIIQGVESATPVAPTYDTNYFTICEVYNRVGETSIKETDDTVNGYIYKHSRVNPLPIEFGDGSDGDVTISVATTLTRDMQYNNLTVNSTLDTAGYRVFVKNTLSGTGTIKNNGGNGGNGGDDGDGYAGASGIGGTGGLSGSISGGVDGANGQQAGKNIIGLGVNGSNGGIGGSASGSSGPQYSGGIITQESLYLSGKLNTISPIINYNIETSTNPSYNFDIMFVGSGSVYSQYMGVSAQSAGGSRGGVNVNTPTYGGGGGGGAGGAGGMIEVIAKIIQGTLTFQAKGGNGGNGGNSNGSSGVGGGGAGGAGGVVILIYRDTSTFTGTIDVSGGVGGALGTVGDTSYTSPSENGLTGNYYKCKII